MTPLVKTADPLREPYTAALPPMGASQPIFDVKTRWEMVDALHGLATGADAALVKVTT